MIKKSNANNCAAQRFNHADIQNHNNFTVHKSAAIVRLPKTIFHHHVHNLRASKPSPRMDDVHSLMLERNWFAKWVLSLSDKRKPFNRDDPIYSIEDFVAHFPSDRRTWFAIQGCVPEGVYLRNFIRHSRIAEDLVVLHRGELAFVECWYSIHKNYFSRGYCLKVQHGCTTCAQPWRDDWR